MNLRHRTIGSIRLCAAAGLFIAGNVLFIVPSARRLATAQQASSGAPSKTISLRKIAAAEMPVPFRIGEILNYRVEWAIFPNAAALQINVRGAPQPSRLADLALPRVSTLPRSGAHAL